MESEFDSDFENEQEFWNGGSKPEKPHADRASTDIELDETISKEYDNHGAIDDALRSYLTLTLSYREKYLESDYDIGYCSDRLITSPLFTTHPDYVRKQFVHSLLQDDEPDVLLIASAFLLADAQESELGFELLNQEGGFPRLVNLIAGQKKEGEEWLHRVLMQVLYEMSRIQKISLDHLAVVDDAFIRGLFEIIENVSGDVTDPYHYPVIRVLLVLNEQFMLSAHDPDVGSAKSPLTNKIIKVLSVHGSKYKTFGENIILLLNREDETSLQLLTLKLLYLLFTTPPTYEYFYTNDLRVLVDILIRNLLDLPEEARSLRHTYLRVLYPLLRHTQLQIAPHYKRAELQKLLLVLMNGEFEEVNPDNGSLSPRGHFEDVDETTKRLVKRCQTVEWLYDPDELPTTTLTESPIAEEPELEEAATPKSQRSSRPAIPLPRSLRRREGNPSSLSAGRYLAPQLESARQSSLSMVEVAAQKEKPGVLTPSRNPAMKHGLRAAIIFNKKDKPPLPPQARRPGWGMLKRSTTDMEVSRAGRAEKNAVKTAAEVKRVTNLEPTAEEPAQEAKVDGEDKAKVDPKTDAKAENKTEAKKDPKTDEKAAVQAKKPPPAPKRRWRGKQTKEEKLSGRREPGKFSSSMPSMASGGVKVEEMPEEQNREEKVPDDMSSLERTLSPELILSPASEDTPFFNAEEVIRSPSADGRPVSPRPPFTVSKALQMAQAHAAEGIEETLDKVHLKSPPALPPARKGASHPPPSPHTSAHLRPSLSQYGTPRGSSQSIDTLTMSQSQTLPPVPSPRVPSRARSNSQSSIPPPLPSPKPPSSRRGSRATQSDLPMFMPSSPQPSSLANSMMLPAAPAPPPPPSRGSQLTTDSVSAPARPTSPKPHFPEDFGPTTPPHHSSLIEEVDPSDIPSPTDEVVNDDEDDDDDHFPEFDDDDLEDENPEQPIPPETTTEQPPQTQEPEKIEEDPQQPAPEEPSPPTPAQPPAIHQVQETSPVKSARSRSIAPPPPPPPSTHGHHRDHEGRSMFDATVRPSQVVLAPPGQAPPRGVPAPHVDFERSPFLSEDESGEGKKGATSP